MAQTDQRKAYNTASLSTTNTEFGPSERNMETNNPFAPEHITQTGSFNIILYCITIKIIYVIKFVL